MNLISKLFIIGTILGVSTSCAYLDQWDDNDAHTQKEKAVSTEDTK